MKKLVFLAIICLLSLSGCAAQVSKQESPSNEDTVLSETQAFLDLPSFFSVKGNTDYNKAVEQLNLALDKQLIKAFQINGDKDTGTLWVEVLVPSSHMPSNDAEIDRLFHLVGINDAYSQEMTHSSDSGALYVFNSKIDTITNSDEKMDIASKLLSYKMQSWDGETAIGAYISADPPSFEYDLHTKALLPWVQEASSNTLVRFADK